LEYYVTDGPKALSPQFADLGQKILDARQQALGNLLDVEERLESVQEVGALAIQGTATSPDTSEALEAAHVQASFDFDVLSAIARPLEGLRDEGHDGLLILGSVSDSDAGERKERPLARMPEQKRDLGELSDTGLSAITDCRRSAATTEPPSSVSAVKSPRPYFQAETKSDVNSGVDDFLLLIMENDGVIERGRAASVAGVVRPKLRMNYYGWKSARQQLEEKGLVYFERMSPHSAKDNRAVLNEQALREAVRRGEVSEQVARAVERYTAAYIASAEDTPAAPTEPDVEPEEEAKTGTESISKQDAEELVEIDDEPEGEDEGENKAADTETAPTTRNNGLADHLPSNRAQRAATAERRQQEVTKAQRDNRKVKVWVHFDGRTLNRTISTKRFNKLPSSDKLMLGVALLMSPKFSSLFNTPEKANTFLLTLVNKGIEEGSEEYKDNKGLTELIDEGAESGRLVIDDDTPGLSSEGMDYLMAKKRW
jgi:hypothetical protein